MTIPMEQLEKLAAAVELLERRKGKAHCVGDLAQNKDGDSVAPKSNTAVAFCALGAFERVGVAIPTRVAFARYLLKHSRLAKQALDDEDLTPETVDSMSYDEVIFQLNDHEDRHGRHRGKAIIRKHMVGFIHQEVKGHGEKEEGSSKKDEPGADSASAA